VIFGVYHGLDTSLKDLQIENANAYSIWHGEVP